MQLLGVPMWPNYCMHHHGSIWSICQPHVSQLATCNQRVFFHPSFISFPFTQRPHTFLHRVTRPTATASCILPKRSGLQRDFLLSAEPSCNKKKTWKSSKSWRIGGSRIVDVDCESMLTCFHCEEGPESWARIPRPNLQELQKVPNNETTKRGQTIRMRIWFGMMSTDGRKWSGEWSRWQSLQTGWSTFRIWD